MFLMARSFKFKETSIDVGDTVTLTYRVKEGDKERQQKFSGIVIKVKGQNELTRSFTVRKISRSGIGIERIVPVSSAFLVDIKRLKKGSSTRAKLYYIRNLSEQEIRHKIYH